MTTGPTGFTSPTEAGPTGGLCGRVDALCRVAAPHLPPGGPVAAALAAVRLRLAEPGLRIAVGGRMNAGKSTLVNALLGRRLAATGATECTTLVAWFRGGVQNRLEVRRTDGRRYHVPGRPGGGIPRDVTLLGSAREEIEEIVVETAGGHGPGRPWTLVDTPGMDTLSGLDGVALRALGAADALLYVMPHPGAGDAEALESLRRQAHDRMTALNVVGVLSRIDELGDGTGDPWPRARRVAATYTTRLTGLLSGVVPVAGLLAQTALGEEFTEADAVLLRRLAAAPRDDLDRALYCPHEFLHWPDGPLDAPGRARVLDLLGCYGIGAAVDAVPALAGGPGPGARALLAALREASGIDVLLDEIGRRFDAAADRLRAAAALGLLDEAARTALGGEGPDPAARRALDDLRAGVAALRRHPLLRQTELAPALADFAAGRLRLSEPDAESLLRLATGTTTAACLGLPEPAPGTTASQAAHAARTAADAAARWRQLESGPSRILQRHARTARELCEELYFRAAAP
ncbi:dynamin family protein [Streptomyces erythrochromogenes]|uniref:dynamin family protein n=1 Tax=Streptomyces erythrochromogenes TaxID=285574 RepID=UPI00030B49F8